MGQATSRDGGSQAEGGEDEGEGHEWTQFYWVLTSFPFEKNREMREEVGGWGEKQQRRREGMPYPPYGLWEEPLYAAAVATNHKAPIQAVQAEWEGLSLPLSDLIGQRPQPWPHP